jgi:ABC-type branched-subunit amino acid transport system ATPase component
VSMLNQSHVDSSATGVGSILQVHELRKNFGGVEAVSGTSFEVPRRGITGLIGPNGAGKSTAVSLIGGNIRPSSGLIMFDGRDITGLPAKSRARRGLIRTFQLSSEFPKLTVLENLLVAAPSSSESLRQSLMGRHAWRAERERAVTAAFALLGQFGLEDKANGYAGQLSGGQKRIVEIARALMANPRLLVLDEPMAGVSPAMRPHIVEHLIALRDQGLPMLLVEHEMSIIEQCCDQVIVMARGQKLAEGTMADVRANEEVREAYLA